VCQFELMPQQRYWLPQVAAAVLQLSIWIRPSTGSSLSRQSGRHSRAQSFLQGLETSSTNGKCSLVTGGDCFIFDCNDSRGGPGKVQCVQGYCLCKAGFCNLNGACVTQPGEDDTDKLWKPVHQEIHWATHPEMCLSTADGYVRIVPCGEKPEKFVLPVGPVGQIEIGETGFCLSMLSNAPSIGAYASSAKCDKANQQQQWEMPNGGTGMIRWHLHPDSCLDVEQGKMLPGTPLELQLCDKDDLDEMFGTSFVPPPPHLSCTSGAGCSVLKEMAKDAFCNLYPHKPWCRRLKQCPSGGCGKNGECIEGTCICKVHFTGPTCELDAPGPIPLYALGGGAPGPATFNVFGAGAPAPAPAPGPALAPAR